MTKTREVFVTLTVNSKPFDDAMSAAVRAACSTIRAVARLVVRLHRALCQDPRCRICHPLANPTRLPIDGRAYARKRAHR